MHSINIVFIIYYRWILVNLPNWSFPFLILICFSNDTGNESAPPDSVLMRLGEEIGDLPGDNDDDGEACLRSLVIGWGEECGIGIEPAASAWSGLWKIEFYFWDRKMYYLPFILFQQRTVTLKK